MGAVVIYAMAKNARGNSGKRAPKTKAAAGGGGGGGAVAAVSESDARGNAEEERKDGCASVRFRG